MVLGLYGQHQEAGVFAAASSIALIAALPRMAVASNFAPMVSALYARAELASLQRLSARAAGLSLLSTLAVVIPIFTALDDVIGLFGPNFRSGAAAAAILLLAQLFASACGPHQHLLTMTRHEKTVAVIFAGGAGVTLLLAMALVPLSGGIGAAFAGAAGIVCMNVALLVAVKRKLDLAPGLLVLIPITIDPVRRAGRWEKKGIGT
jgi:O-antigen/teichoic acid export membrane protein